MSGALLQRTTFLCFSIYDKGDVVGLFCCWMYALNYLWHLGQFDINLGHIPFALNQ